MESFKKSLKKLVSKFRDMSSEEFRKILIDRKMIDSDGELADHYCTEEQLEEKKERRKNARRLRQNRRSE